MCVYVCVLCVCAVCVVCVFPVSCLTPTLVYVCMCAVCVVPVFPMPMSCTHPCAHARLLCVVCILPVLCLIPTLVCVCVCASGMCYVCFTGAVSCPHPCLYVRVCTLCVRCVLCMSSWCHVWLPLLHTCSPAPSHVFPRLCLSQARFLLRTLSREKEEPEISSYLVTTKCLLSPTQATNKRATQKMFICYLRICCRAGLP